MHRPPVLFLDEPTTGLDPRGRNDLWIVIEELVGDGATVLLTTQYLEEADRLADNIAVVDHGRVIAEGTAAELKAQLGNTIVRVELHDGSALDATKTALANVGPTDIGDDRHSVELKVSDSGASLLDAVRALDAAGVQPAAISVREPSLDDVFLQLTGHAAEESGNDEEEDR